MKSRSTLILPLALALAASSPAAAECDLTGLADGSEVAEITTPLGTVCMLLLRDDAPKHVANFVHYLESGNLVGTFFHRAAPGFVVQGGGFRVAGGTYVAVQPSGPFAAGDPDCEGSQSPGVCNEPCTPDIPAPPPANPSITVCSQRGNERGTVALAKLGGSPSSGTTNWFVNVADNRANLDNQNGGFTVFARVLGDGMAVVDAIDALVRAGDERLFWADSRFITTFEHLPLQSDVPLFAPGFGCFDVRNLAAVVDPANPTVGLQDPVTGGLFFVSGECGTQIELADFVENPSQTACPDPDRLARGITGVVSPIFFRNDPTSGLPIAFSLTCDETQENLTQRALWQADFRQRLNSQLVEIEAAQLHLVPEPGSAAMRMAALTVLAALARRRRQPVCSQI